jgi:2-hydroxychromene-2-carboxylate isomerase
MGDLILLETAVLPGRGVANCSVSQVNAAPAAVAAGASLTEREGRIRAGNESSVRESRPSARLREGGRRTSSAVAAPHGRAGNGSDQRLRARNGGTLQRLNGWSRGSDKRLHALPAFFFDLACPLSYVAAERVERLLGEVDWVPTPSAVVQNGAGQPDCDALVVQATTLARGARLPLVWPDQFPAPVPRALRAAAYAAEGGAGAGFALAASRLAFCGGFDLEKRSVLAEVAAAAGVPVDECLAAAEEDWRDDELAAGASLLKSQGVSHLPVVGIDERWFDGVQSLSEAAAWLRRD